MLASEVESTVSGEMAVLESGGGVEFSGSIAMAQSRVMQSNGAEGKLDGGGKRIPVGLEGLRLGSGGHGEIEIVDQQTACKLWRRE